MGSQLNNSHKLDQNSLAHNKVDLSMLNRLPIYNSNMEGATPYLGCRVDIFWNAAYQLRPGSVYICRETHCELGTLLSDYRQTKNKFTTWSRRVLCKIFYESKTAVPQIVSQQYCIH